jgi:uncharacterized membrane protein (UPF0182 family)
VFPIEEQRIYFSSYPVGTLESESYVLLNTKLDEFDYPAEPEALHKWSESRGIPIAGALAKFVFSALAKRLIFIMAPSLRIEPLEYRYRSIDCGLCAVGSRTVRVRSYLYKY